MKRLESRTASADHSIWSPLTEDLFRQHLVGLEQRTNAVPVDPQTFPLKGAPTAEIYSLPFRVEQQLADDLAFLAAIEEGAQSVAAVCIEERIQPQGLTVRFAALDLAIGGEVKASLQQIADILTSLIYLPDDRTKIDVLFEHILKLHSRRLLARLRSDKWVKPKYLSKQHKKPLWLDFANLLHRVQFLYTKGEAMTRRAVEKHVQDLALFYEAFEAFKAGSADEFGSLEKLIKASYDFCKDGDVTVFARRLEDSPSTTPTAKVASAIKCLRQIEKIAAYWRIAISLVNTSREYPALFKDKLQLELLTPYESVPTTIGYEAWATSCHVHAEVQLAVYYDILHQPSSEDLIQPNHRRPRAIGTSKWLCYLCYLFLRYHDCYAPANTHGRLYDQWTIPDIDAYGDEMRRKYRNILDAMDQVVLQGTNEKPEAEQPGLIRWRAEPMTSRQNLLTPDNVD